MWNLCLDGNMHGIISRHIGRTGLGWIDGQKSPVFHCGKSGNPRSTSVLHSSGLFLMEGDSTTHSGSLVGVFFRALSQWPTLNPNCCQIWRFYKCKTAGSRYFVTDPPICRSSNKCDRLFGHIACMEFQFQLISLIELQHQGKNPCTDRCP